ncbi:MAG: hypothetical protein ACI4GV_07365 [Acutalibacteraceae bacterium]
MFTKFGYTEKKIKVRQMTMGAIALTVAKELIEYNDKEMEIRIVDCFIGEVSTYKGMDELLTQNFNADYKVNIYGCSVMHDNRTDKDYLKVIISDEVEV